MIELLIGLGVGFVVGCIAGKFVLAEYSVVSAKAKADVAAVVAKV
jgi:hypothetical protein